MDGLLKVKEEESDATIKTEETADFEATETENYSKVFDFIKSEEIIIPSTSAETADTKDATTYQETYKSYLYDAVYHCAKCHCKAYKSYLSQVRCGDNFQPVRYFCKKCLASAKSHLTYHGEYFIYKRGDELCTSGCEDCSEMKAYIEYHGGKSVEFKCDTCKQIFSEKEKLKLHIWNRHEKKKRRKYSCSKCDKVLDSQKAMREHKLSSHRQQYICVVCQSVFNSQKCLELHFDYIHRHGANLICRITGCGYTFERKEDLIEHFALEHGTMTRFACIECKAIFTNKKKLEMHFNYYHASKDRREENQIRCEMCERTFAHETNLKIHISSQHSRKTFFVCVVCKTVFNEQNKLEAHFEEVHDGAKTTFSCAECKRSFANEAHYKKHGDAMCVLQRAVSADGKPLH